MASIEEALSNTRFGLGGGFGSSADPKLSLIEELARFDPAAGVGSCPRSVEIIPQMRAYQRLRGDQPEDRKRMRQALRRSLEDAANARLGLAISTPTPFAERLVQFWANHFAVSTDKFAAAPLAGAYEAEAIRPNVMGRFVDMLQAAESHPAMLLYLDQARSIGPNSPMAQNFSGNRRRIPGINENLAREVLELHTMGVRSGYTQADVRQFAFALTGWTLQRGRTEAQLAGTGFHFDRRAHEPGERTVLGKTYRQAGVGQARAILDALAAHPATARHIATKLARHFVADDPPQSLVARLERNFLKNSGDLPSLYRELVEAPEAWQRERQKFLTPLEWTVASLRTIQVGEERIGRIRSLLRNLGQELWRPGSPAGFEDRASRWAAPDALYRRVEAAHSLARFAVGMDARTLAPQLYGDLLSASTRTAIRRAESPSDAIALLLASPEAMWR